MDSIKTSYFNRGVGKDPETGELRPKYVWTHGPLQVVDLKTAWLYQEKIDPNSIKGAAGMIFALDYDKFWSIEELKQQGLTSNGVIFIDIDSGIEARDKIFEKIDDINIKMCNNILGASTTRKGLHILCLSDRVTVSDYVMRVFERLTMFAWVTKELTGIDLRSIDKALDACTFTMNQRLFLYYSPKVYWNDTANNISNLSDSGGLEESPLENEIRVNNFNKLKQEYPVLWGKVEDRLGLKAPPEGMHITQKAPVLGIANVDKYPYIEHTTRWRLYDSLCCLYEGDEVELKKQWDRCCDIIDPVNHSAEFFKDEPRKNKWLARWRKSDSKTMDEDLLQGFGYYLGKTRSLTWFEDTAPKNIDELL